MSVTSIAQVRALVKTGVADSDLQDIIDREEAYLARELRAPIAGSRTQNVWRAPFALDFNDIYLQRPTDSLTSVVDNGVSVDLADVRLLEAGYVIERTSDDGTTGAWQGPLIAITYTPNDLLEVQRVVVELCRLTLIETGFSSEDIGTYKYDHGRLPATSMQIQQAGRRTLVRTLLPIPRMGSVSLSSGHLDRVAVPASVS